MSRGKYYTPEFKEQAARKVVEGSLKVAQVARELDVNETTLGCWVTAYEPQAHRVVQHSVRRYDGNVTAPPSVNGLVRTSFVPMWGAVTFQARRVRIRT